MNDVEDDARYPPNPGSQYLPHRHHVAHSQRPKPPVHSQFSRNFSDQDDDEEEDDDESNSEGIDNNHHNGNGNANTPVHHRPARHMDEGEDEAAVDDHDDDSSMESRGKRRKLDNFEFVPRKQPPAATVSNSKSPGFKNSSPDWSEDSTFTLLDVWGDLYVKNGRKSLRCDEWSEVAKKVNQASRSFRSDSQCRNRLDTLKKKYKKEKARMAELPNFKSDWVYFKNLDSLMSSPAPAPATKSLPARLACGVDAGEYVFANSRVYLNRGNAMDEMKDSPGDTGTDDDGHEDEDDDESDGLPPTMGEKRKGRGRSGSGSGSSTSSSFRLLAESIQKFGEVYEKIEINKRQQMVELERMRKEFHRDLEAQKRQILERAQAEIARIRQVVGEDEEEEEQMAGDGDGDDDGDDEIDGFAENLSG